ncbi:MAG: tRNA pseudouridine(38-40) synthase TruA [Gemmatimonadota bacterium]|nr:tRNA pseudouridine(38-40) synthase TruA [Gemmatimonadota bacterium]
MRRNIRLQLEYDGTDFKGWQVQPDQRTVQGTLESCLTSLLGHPIRAIGAGRTDAGVHALGQVANFYTINPLPLKRIGAALNGTLPPDVAVLDVDEVAPAFHARRSARRRTYLYRMAYRRRAIGRKEAWHLRSRLNIHAMRSAANRILGYHDFTSFCVASSEKENRNCRVFACILDPIEDAVHVEISADRFLRSMVRGIVGTLVQVGRGKRTPDAMDAILQARNRQCAGPNAPPQGLFLKEVTYEVPEE